MLIIVMVHIWLNIQLLPESIDLLYIIYKTNFVQELFNETKKYSRWELSWT